MSQHTVVVCECRSRLFRSYSKMVIADSVIDAGFRETIF